jgi:hypothetical protein
MDQPVWQVADYRHGKVIWWRFFRSQAEALEAVGLPEAAPQGGENRRPRA